MAGSVQAEPLPVPLGMCSGMWCPFGKWYARKRRAGPHAAAPARFEYKSDGSIGSVMVTPAEVMNRLREILRLSKLSS